MLGAIAHGTTKIENLSDGGDVQSTIACLRALGVTIECHNGRTVVHGRGLDGLTPPRDVLFAGNSGTTVRLLSGMLAGQPFSSAITGDESIRRRPMSRIVVPLREMGADIRAADGEHVPLTIIGGHLSPIAYDLPVPSAQVKSCLLLAGLYVDGTTTVSERITTRDHTERMLQTFGARVERTESRVSVTGPSTLAGQKLFVPGDLSSAAFFIAAAVLLPGSELRIQGVGLNATRKAFLSLLTDMGANIEILNVAEVNNELLADISATSSNLRGVEISGSAIPALIDEIPVLAVLATQAEGRTTIRDAKELRYKESDRLHAMTTNLSRMGARIKELDDGLIIEGPVKLRSAQLDSFNDHRIAMACTIAGTIAEDPTLVRNARCVDVSFPAFFEQWQEISIG